MIPSKICRKCEPLVCFDSFYYHLNSNDNIYILLSNFDLFVIILVLFLASLFIISFSVHVLTLTAFFKFIFNFVFCHVL